jgi:hypothetical protein
MTTTVARVLDPHQAKFGLQPQNLARTPAIGFCVATDEFGEPADGAQTEFA